MSIRNLFKFPNKPFKSNGGADVPHRKYTSDIETEFMPAPSKVLISMQQHIGSSCMPCVKPGDYVCVGQMIGNSDAYVSAPIHASVSGTVKNIQKIQLPTGNFTDCVVIESDGKMKAYDNLCPPKVDTAEDLIKAARDSGLVGLGGAGFPSNVKLNVPKDKKVDTLIINVAECEPYITSDYREVIENSWEVISGITTIKKLLNIEKVIIAVENNKPKVIEVLRKLSDKNDIGDNIKILALKSRYPQGAEKVLIKVCTNREVPMGKLPVDVGCLVMNVNSVAFLSKYLKTGMPLVSKRITVDGSAIKEPKNIMVPIGTRIADIIDFCGGYKSEPKKIIMGGPMMGIAVVSDDVPILKQNNAILVFDEKEAKLEKSTDCIRCGRCIDACPMSLMPTLLERYSIERNFEQLQKLNIMNCMECGCCSYSCPAKRQLVQSIRLGKAIIRNSKRG